MKKDVFKNLFLAGNLFIFALTIGCRRKLVHRVKVPEIKNIFVSSSDPDFPAGLIFDDKKSPKAAWHSELRPSFPQWIKWEYPDKVVVKKIAMQSQYDGNNYKRAPKRMELWGGDPEDFNKLGDFQIDFKESGQWIIAEMPLYSGTYLSYWVVILENHGDPDYVSVQEIQIHSQE